MSNLNERLIYIINSLQDKDISQRNISLRGGSATIIYIKQLTDKKALSELVIQPIVENKDDPKLCPANIGDYIFAQQFKVLSDDADIESQILEGMCILLFSNSREYVVIDLKHVQKRQVTSPETAYTIRGPKDSFIEDIETNLSLIRYRIKDKNLRIDNLVVGERTKTTVDVLYISDIANNTCVSEVKKRIQNIEIDGIVESGELQQFLLNKKINFFPQMGIIERSDMACNALLEGKVVVFVEGSGWALVAPKTFGEFLWSCEDFYGNKFVGLFLRLLRFLALLISFTISSLYVAIVSFHNDVLPSGYMIAIAESRSKVPFNALVEVLLIEFIAELIHESLARVPKKIGAGIGIVGAIIIGQAAVSAGVFSPLLLIVVSIGLISTFIPRTIQFLTRLEFLSSF